MPYVRTLFLTLFPRLHRSQATRLLTRGSSSCYRHCQCQIQDTVGTTSSGPRACASFSSKAAFIPTPSWGIVLASWASDFVLPRRCIACCADISRGLYIEQNRIIVGYIMVALRSNAVEASRALLSPSPRGALNQAASCF